MVPANTLSPADLSTGKLSPVIGAWLMLDRPAVTTPSRATRSPGLTRTIWPMATALAGSSTQSPSACCTVAISGVSCSKLRMALRARSKDFASINSARVNRTMTMAASGHCRSNTAPVTAMLIRALILRLPWRNAIQPFLKVPTPLIVMATRANSPDNHSGKPSQWTISAPRAASPASANGHQGLPTASVDTLLWLLVSIGSVLMPKSRMAVSTTASVVSWWTTVRTRCMRLNSIPLTVARPLSLLRINASSVGQSIWATRRRVSV